MTEQSIRGFRATELCIEQKDLVPRRAVLVFAGVTNASRNVAGVPAAARAVRVVAKAGIRECWIVAGAVWQPNELIRGEVERLAGATIVSWLPAEELSAIFSDDGILLVAGESLVAAGNMHDALADNWVLPIGLEFAAAAGGHQIFERIAAARAAGELDDAELRIVASTTKPSDGIVSRKLNRPISQAISRRLLKWPGIRPIHATAVTTFLAVAMVLSLLAGGDAGLIAGAMLFQAASIFDGVDGEIARATFRTSRWGAMADSLVDAATNIGFIGGVVVNLWIQGNTFAAMVGAAGLAMMAIGLFLIGRRARSGTGKFTFNAVKDHFRGPKSRPMQWLIWLTMRDFYALAAVLFVVTGFAAEGLVAFGVIASGWLVVVLAVLMRRRA